MSELNPLRFWRLTLDNLDFKAKFAKKVEVRDGSCVLNRMFHLLTSQVTFRKNEECCSCTQETLELVFSVAPSDLKEKHFKIKHCDDQWIKFNRFVFRSVCGVIGTSTSSILYELRKHMSHWTPIKSDVVVYTTVTEAYSGSIDDVSKFVMKLKDDLKIGTDGFPKYLVTGGDQQTYAHISNLLKIKYPGHYDWV